MNGRSRQNPGYRLIQLNNLMKICEIEQLDESWEKNFATLALMAAGLGNIGMVVKQHLDPQTVQASNSSENKELTLAGRKAIKDLPRVIQKHLGDINTIYFVKGIPPGGSPTAVCQVEKGKRIIYVNPKNEQEFLNGATDQLTAHELTHIAQSNMNKRLQDKFAPTDPNNKYGITSSKDAWKVLSDERKRGSRMWNFSREEQAMIVQQRTAAQYDLNSYMKLKRTDPEMKAAIEQQKKIIAIYDQYIDDYNEN